MGPCRCDDTLPVRIRRYVYISSPTQWTYTAEHACQAPYLSDTFHNSHRTAYVVHISIGMTMSRTMLRHRYAILCLADHRPARRCERSSVELELEHQWASTWPRGKRGVSAMCVRRLKLISRSTILCSLVVFAPLPKDIGDAERSRCVLPSPDLYALRT